MANLQQATPSRLYNPIQPYDAPVAKTRVTPPTDGGFAVDKQAASMDANYKMPYMLTHYTGEKDPEDHLKSFKAAMQI